jgi:hypothetical protein
MQFVKAVAIQPDGQVVEVPPDVSPKTPPPGKWYMRAQNIDDIGVILVNGWPVGGTYSGSSEWIDITSYLDTSQDNTVAVWTWSVGGPFSYRFSIRRDETIVWEKESRGEHAPGVVFSETVSISPEGKLKLAESLGPSWSVRAYNVNDAATIFVNEEMASGALIGFEEGWVDITNRLVTGQETRVVFASWNGPQGGLWGFSIRQGNTVVWGVEGGGGTPYTMQFVKAVAIQPDGQVVEVPPDVSPKTPPPGKWYMRAQNIDDIGVILVNGWPVGGAHSYAGSTDWIDITPQLDSNRDNEVAMYTWNVGGPFFFRFTLRQDEETVWEFERPGSGLLGVVFKHVLIITPDGQVVQKK